MHSFTAIAALFSAFVAVEAGPQHVPMGNYARHAAVIRRAPAPAPVLPPSWSRTSRGLSRRCKPHTSSKPPAPVAPAAPAPATGASSPPSTSGGNSGGSSGGNGGGNGATINFRSSCGDLGATPNSGNDAGPNGAEFFLNCRLHDDGWQPQNVQLADLVYVKDLGQAITQSGTPFGPCAPYVDLFERIGAEEGVPPILIASFAMQESSCRPEVTGGAGEIGMMQITPDKCGGAPGNDCYNLDFNVRTGTKYFKTVLDSVGGNVLEATGQYNGWYRGMKPGDVLGNPCAQQQNLDYLHHVFNHWMQNKDPNGAGTERNKQACGGY